YTNTFIFRSLSAIDISHVAAIHLFFFHHTPTTQIYTLSLHDALPISASITSQGSTTNYSGTYATSNPDGITVTLTIPASTQYVPDRKSTRLNSSHVAISYAVFCLKKKNHALFFSFRRNATRTPANHRA